jgi:polyhydroxybutyrate depolymerase
MQNAPLVLVLHGFTSSAHKIMDYCGINQLAIENGFAVVYPQGTKDKKGNTFWNVGYDFHSNSTVDDLDFIVKLTEHLQETFSFSETNTFITGMSNGGEMSYLLACRHPDKFGAIATVAGTMMHSFFEDCNPSQPVPLLSIFGTKDKITNYLGDDKNKDGWGAYKSTPFIIDFWANKLNLHIVTQDTLPDIEKSDSSFVVRQQFKSSSSGNEFIYYEVVGGDHDWPGAWGNKDMNATKEIWRFFETHLQ